MAVRIRLARSGTKKRPFYRLVAADSRMKRDGRYLEKLGTYNPFEKDQEKSLVLRSEAIEKWLKVGASPSDAVIRLLKKGGIDQILPIVFLDRMKRQQSLPKKLAKQAK